MQLGIIIIIIITCSAESAEETMCNTPGSAAFSREHGHN